MTSTAQIAANLKTSLKSYLGAFGDVFFPKFDFAPDVQYKVYGNVDHFFVGYYDIDPIRPKLKTRDLLCHRVSTKYSNRIEPESAEVGLMNLDTSEFKVIDHTQAVNWQLGSRAQWLDGDRIILNDGSEEGHFAKIVRVDNRRIEGVCKRAFWAISPDKKYGAALNFSRLKKLRPGYGYLGPSADGEREVFTLYKIENDEIVFQIGLEEILKTLNFRAPPDADLYLNHVTWSPCSKKLLTLFHYEDHETKTRAIYPVLLDCETFKISLFYDGGVFSHHVWVSPKELLAFLKIEGEKQFALWTEGAGWTLLPSFPKRDGHPSLIPGDSNRVVVDSYPDRWARLNLYLAPLRSNQKPRKLGTIHNPSQYSRALRCDLHPRVSVDSDGKNNLVICDVPFKDRRRILVASVERDHVE